MASFTAGTTFTDGVANDVTAAKLGALVTAATPTSGLIQDRTAETVIATNDTLLIGDASDSNNLKRMTVANLLKAPLVSTSGTIDNLTTGTTTSTNEVVTNGTITNLSATTSTFLGTITGSTNVVNIGSGQIYKDASGNVGIGTTSPTDPNSFGRALDIQSAGGGMVYTRASGDTSKYGIYGFSGGNTSIGAFGASTGLRVWTSGTERMRVDSSGDVGIGTTSVTSGYKLDTRGWIRAQHPNGDCVVAAIAGNTTGVSAIYFGDSADDNPGSIEYNHTSNSVSVITNGTNRLSINSSGDVTITDLAGAGSRAVNASAAGLLSAASDASLKEEVIGAHIAGLAEILQIHPKMYRWKDDIANRGDEASVELGFIANDVAPIIPSAAPLGNDGLYGFYDRSITAALVKAVQELKAENDSLKSRIESLEAK